MLDQMLDSEMVEVTVLAKEKRMDSKRVLHLVSSKELEMALLKEPEMMGRCPKVLIQKGH